MATIINASIDVTKIDRTKLIKDKYLNLSIIVDDKNDKFGNNVSITLSQSKEERDATSTPSPTSASRRFLARR